MVVTAHGEISALKTIVLVYVTQLLSGDDAALREQLQSVHSRLIVFAESMQLPALAELEELKRCESRPSPPEPLAGSREERIDALIVRRRPRQEQSTYG